MKPVKESVSSQEKPPRKVAAMSHVRLVGTVFLWILLWPVYIGVIALVVVMLFAGAVGLVTSGSEPEGYMYRAGALFFTGVMTIICLFIIRRRNRGESRGSRVSAVVLKGYVVLGIILGAGIASFIPDMTTDVANAGIQTQTVSGVQIPTLQHDPRLVEVLGQVGATDIDLIDKQFVEGYSDQAYPEKWGEYQAFINQATGQFAYGKLTIRRGLDPEQEKVSVAHEYLHHVWFKLLDAETKESLTAQLIGMYGNDFTMRERVKDYVSAGELYPTELFSYYCTESSDGYLTQYVLDTCNKYINRAALRLAR